MNLKSYYHLYGHKIFLYLFTLVFLTQIAFWLKTHEVRRNIGVVPEPPNQYLVNILSLGDKEFLFRVLGARLQNSGDVFAGFVPLKNYDYSKVYSWMKILDQLNSISNYIPSLASYYYSQTQNKKDNYHIVKYLDEHAARNVDGKWWWLFQATFIAKDDIKDLDLALDIANKLSNNEAKKAPLWTRQMPAFVYEEMGNECMAFRVIEKMMQENEAGGRKISVEEMDFMRTFIQRTFRKLKAKNFNPIKCKKI